MGDFKVKSSSKSSIICKILNEYIDDNTVKINRTKGKNNKHIIIAGEFCHPFLGVDETIRKKRSKNSKYVNNGIKQNDLVVIFRTLYQ